MEGNRREEVRKRGVAERREEVIDEKEVRRRAKDKQREYES